jgi:acetylornithine/N-succinyldiaminopimelate aminotransferase
MGALLRSRVEEVCARFPGVVTEVRGLGLMMGFKPVMPNTEMVAKLADGGLLTVGAGDNIVRLLPPLIIDDAQVDEAVGILSRTFGEVK